MNEEENTQPRLKGIELPTRENWIAFDHYVLGYINVPNRRRDANGRVIVSPVGQPSPMTGEE